MALVQLLESGTLPKEEAARFHAVMRRAGVDQASLVQQHAQVPLRWFHEVYPDLNRQQSTDLGFAFAEQAQLTTFGPLTLPLVSAGSVGDVVELLTFLPLLSAAVTPHFHHGVHGLTVGLSGHTGHAHLDCLVVTYAGSALLRLLDMLAGDVPAVTLHLGWPRPSATRLARGLGSDRIHFDAAVSYLHIPPHTLTGVCRFSDPVAYRLAVEDLHRTLEHRTGSASTSAKVRRLLERGAARASMRATASELAMSASTLKRRLADEGTSFTGLQQSFLQERATLRLLHRDTSVSEIAAELGYSDISNFSHAFKRWTGRSPGQFRGTAAERSSRPTQS